MFLGTVSWRSKSDDRGFAFVKADAPLAIEGIDEDGTVFVGRNTLVKCNAMDIARGDRCEFSVKPSKSKPGRCEIASIRIIEKVREAA